jgi:hypothetical protein
MFDVNKTLNIIKGGLLEPGVTWKAYLDENHDWKETLTLVAGPLIIVSAIAAATFSWIFSSHTLFGQRTGFWGLLLGIVAAAIGLVVTGFMFSFFAGIFKGKHDFNKGLAAVTLAAIPAYVGGIFSTLPWIGWLLALALSIVSLVFLYRIIPAYLEVPEDRRALHYAVSLVASIVIVLVINLALGLGAYSTGNFESAGGPESAVTGRKYGMLGDIGRQAELMDKSEQAVYEPPADGRISEAQMLAFLDVMRKTAELRGRAEAKLKQMEKDMQGEDEPGLSDLGKLSSGFGALFRTMATAEMGVVETGGGNWAEHQWVKEQLRTAAIQQDLNDAVRHNYALYQKYADQLSAYGQTY